MPDARTQFRVWAPTAEQVELRFEDADGHLFPPVHMRRDGEDFLFRSDRVAPGTLYRYSVDGGPWRPDPASRRQPLGVDGPSQVVDLDFDWRDQAWPGVPLDELVLYELHVGTFTSEGTFDAAIAHLQRLRILGVTAVEVMPVAETPGASGARNWGYDGVQPYAVRESFGGIGGLHRFVDACHAHGLAVILDVVYNHLGPKGNHLADFGPFFGDVYSTPWGRAPNLDGPYSDGVRRYFLEHALECFEVHHVDGLRLDAVVTLMDRSARPFLEELSEATDALSALEARPLHLIGETDDNDPRWVRPRSEGGLGLHAMWADDLHHAIHAFLTGERGAYYADFGCIEQVARAFFAGSALEGAYAQYRRRRWGRALESVPPHRLVVYAQNHDQVGNRADGARLGRLVGEAAHRAGLALALLAPYLPLLFMGQEYGESRPFYFFTSFQDPGLAEAVLHGRRDVVAAFGEASQMPDPEDPASRDDSVLRRTGASEELFQMHRAALRLRRVLQATTRPRPAGVWPDQGAFAGAWDHGYSLFVVLSSGTARLNTTAPGALVFDSARDLKTLKAAPNEIEAKGWLELEGPRVLVYGPERVASSENNQ